MEKPCFSEKQNDKSRSRVNQDWIQETSTFELLLTLERFALFSTSTEPIIRENLSNRFNYRNFNGKSNKFFSISQFVHFTSRTRLLTQVLFHSISNVIYNFSYLLFNNDNESIQLTIQLYNLEYWKIPFLISINLIWLKSEQEGEMKEPRIPCREEFFSGICICLNV